MPPKTKHEDFDCPTEGFICVVESISCNDAYYLRPEAILCMRVPESAPGFTEIYTSVLPKPIMAQENVSEIIERLDALTR